MTIVEIVENSKIAATKALREVIEVCIRSGDKIPRDEETTNIFKHLMEAGGKLPPDLMDVLFDVPPIPSDYNIMSWYYSDPLFYDIPGRAVVIDSIAEFHPGFCGDKISNFIGISPVHWQYAPRDTPYAKLFFMDLKFHSNYLRSL
jgi:hypothetical protein